MAEKSKGNKAEQKVDEILDANGVKTLTCEELAKL